MPPPTDDIFFTCRTCGNQWNVWTDVGCSVCNEPTLADVPDKIWELSHVAGTPFRISANLRDMDRARELSAKGIHRVLDVSNARLDPNSRKFVWYPTPAETRELSLYLISVDGLHDHVINPLERRAVARAIRTALSLADRGHPVMVSCAAGLRRAPHVVYGALIARGHQPERAWEMIQSSRPFVRKIPHYAEVAEDVGKQFFLGAR